MALGADKKTEFKEGVEIPAPVYRAVKIYAGAWVCVNATGFLVPGADTAGLIFHGIARQNVDNSLGQDGDAVCLVRRRGLIRGKLGHAITQANVGDNVFLVDDETLDVAAQTTNDIFCGVIAEYIDGDEAWIDIEPAIRQADVATHIADTSAAHSASAISIGDSGSHFTGEDVETALAELAANEKTAQYTILPVAILAEDGTVLTKFADGETGVGWAQLSNKEVALRWNNQATPNKVAAIFVMPQDLNDLAAVVAHFMGAIIKAGGDEADSPTLTCEAYFSTVGAAMAADTNCGGASTEFVVTEDDKWQEKVLSIAHGDVPASPSVLTLIFNPTDGQLPADDFALLPPWLEVTKKILTA